MALTKQSGVSEARYRPARELAARATSKHGNPADYAVVCSADIRSAADVVAAHVQSEASKLEDRSHRGDISLRVGQSSGAHTDVQIDVAQDGEPILDRGGFALRFAPRSVRGACPRFEGQVRIDHVDAANSRVVAEGRYIGQTASQATAEQFGRVEAEAILRQIVGLLTIGVRSG